MGSLLTDKLWIGLRTRLIDAVSTPDLLKMVEAGGIEPQFLISHSTYQRPWKSIFLGYADCYIEFTFDEVQKAYEAFEAPSVSITPTPS